MRLRSRFPLAAPLPRVLVLAVLLASADLARAAVHFDTDVLRARGINPALAQYFRDAPRFPPGVATVKLRVNGASRGTVRARFDVCDPLTTPLNYAIERFPCRGRRIKTCRLS